MKKLTILAIIFFFISFTPLPILAQSDTSENQKVVQEENTLEETEEKVTTLSEKVSSEENSKVSFFTILATFLIPCIFIIIAYLIFKFFKF